MIFGNKKGNVVVEGITIVILMFVLAVIGVFSFYTFDQLNTDLQADTSMATVSKETSQTLYDNHAPLMDNLFMFAFVLFVLFVIVSAFVIDTHPIFFFISIILLMGVFVVAGIMGNTYDDIMSDSEISAYANEFTYASWVMTHILELMVTIVFLISVVLFIKFKT